jgi:RHS repeat-associated protein
MELNEELGLYDYGARWYDPAVGRFTTVDPAANKMPSWSPYNYTFNNPVKLIDPTGMWPENPFSKVLSKAKNYVVSAAKDYVVDKVRGVKRAINDALSGVTVDAHVRGELSVGLQAGAELDKSVGKVYNLGSAKILTSESGVEATVDGLKSTRGIDYIGENGEVEIRQSTSTSAGTGTAGMGAEAEHEMTVSFENGGMSIVDQTIEGDGGVSAGPVNVTIGGGKNMTTGQSFSKVSAGVGGEASIIIGIRMEAQIGVVA